MTLLLTSIVSAGMALVMKKPEPAPKGELIGYARVSTEDQRLDLQTDALKAVGCLNIYEEKKSGASQNRPQLDLAIKDLRPGDTLVVWRIDRLARTGTELYRRLGLIEQAGAGFRSLQENFDFTTATGRFVLGILGLVAEMERQLTIDRTKAGMAALKARGKPVGRERKVTDKMKDQIRALVLKGWQVKEIAAKFKIHPQSVYGNFKGGKRGILKATARKSKKP